MFPWKLLAARVLFVVVGLPSVASAQQIANPDSFPFAPSPPVASGDATMFRPVSFEASEFVAAAEDPAAPGKPAAKEPGAEAEGPAAGHDPHDPGDLAASYTNPTALLTSWRLITDYNTNIKGTDDSGILFKFQPVVPFEKSDLIPLPQVMRLTAPVQSAIGLPGGEETHSGFGDVQFFDLFVIPLAKDFVFGVGPVAIFPTGTSPATTQGRYQLGPGFAGIYTGIPKWQLGFLGQDLMSIGDSKYPSVHQLLYNPIIVHHLEEGWYQTFCSETAVIDWRTGHGQFPVSAGIGRVFPLDKQPVNFDVVATYFTGATELQPQFQVEFEFAFIYK